VTVEDPSIALPTGSRAQVAVVVATARDVVTLPLSAVTRQGTGAVVRTWDGSTLKRSTVTIGAVGARTVEVTDGVEAGDEVVVADVDQEISGASSTLQRGGFGPPPGAVVFRQGGPGGGGNGPVTVSR
jgi:HlyD family secretion protein